MRGGESPRSSDPVVIIHRVESSWILIQKDIGMRRKYDRLKQWKGAERAIIAIAKRLI